MTTQTDAMEAAGITIESVFVPFSQSRNAGNKGKDYAGKPSKDPLAGLSLNWRVSVKKDGREVLTTDYQAGIGHCPSYVHHVTLEVAEAVAWEVEHGKRWRSSWLNGGRATIGGPSNLRPGDPILPDPADVMYALLSDSDAMDHPSFEDWAGEFGYDTDSRKAEETYRACLAIGLKLRAGLGDPLLQSLREAFQDY